MKRYSKQKFNIDIENMLWLPGNVYWKSKEGVYIGCNDMVAELANLQNRAEMVGTTDYDAPWSDFADIYTHNDKEVVKSGYAKCFEENVVIHSGKVLYGMSVKTPLINQDGNTTGVFGITIFDNNRKFVDIFSELTKTSDKLNIKINNKLSSREKQCVYYLSRGMTAKQIGKQLELSYRTVEFYFERIKNKLNCRDRRELIAKAIDSGILDFVDR